MGKTTTAMRRAATVARLDRPSESGAFRADPDVALQGLPEPVLLDEWQDVPDVLVAVKRSVDSDHRPGRFLVTGSVRARMRSVTWPGTGRLITLPLRGMTVREQVGRLDGELLLDLLPAGRQPVLPDDVPDIRGYVELALRSGFPEAIDLPSPSLRRDWLGSYVEQLVTRDVSELGETRDPVLLRRFLSACAMISACMTTEQALLEAAHVNRRTASAYEHLLTDLFILDALPAWPAGRLSRMSKAPKAAAAVDSGDAKGLRWLRDAMGERFLMGAILHTGPRAYRFDDRILAVPIAALWG